MTPLLFALYLIVYTVAAQQQPTIFSSYRLSSFAILQRSDLMAAYSIVIDPTSSEQVLYVCGEVYGGSKLIPTALRTNANAFILKMNTNGTLIWSFLLGSSTLCLDIEISQTTGELVAIVNSKITGPSYIYSIYKADGTIFWNKELNFEKSIVSLYLTEIQSSGLYVSGTINDGAGKSQVFIINLDPISGNQMWMDSFGGTGDDKAQALTSVNNQLVVMGTISSDLDGQKFSTASSTTCFIAWYGQNGTRDAKRTRLFGSPSDGCMIVTAAYDSSSDSILFTGAFTSPINVVSDKWAGFVGRLSASTGAVKYIQPFSDIIYSSIAADQVLLPDGSWLMCGQTSGQFDQTNLRYGKSDLFLMSVHPENGSILWSFTWGGAQNDACSSLQNHLDSTKKHQIIYTGGWGSSSQEQLVMFLSTFNMTALGEALPFKPIVVSPDPTGNNNTSQPSDTGTNMSPLIAGLVGSFAFIAVSAVLYILHAKQRAKKRPLGEDASNMAITDTAFHLTQIVTKTALPSQSTVNATSITKGLNANNERTMVPSFMGISIPGAYLMDSIASMRYTRQLFKSTNCEIYLGESLDESIRERSHGQPVVIKQFLKTLSGTGQKSFLQELSLMYLFVENDLFVRLYGYHERPHLMVMKHYEGGSLKQFLFQERPADFVFSMEIKFKFMLQISRAISEMHRLGLAHVDLKLQNVFVDIKRGLNGADCEYSCVLGDFGLASILDKSILLVQAYRVHNRRGFSAGYAAPEVIKRVKAGNFFIAQIPAVIKAGDLYAFGIMGYEILQEKIAWRL